MNALGIFLRDSWRTLLGNLVGLGLLYAVVSLVLSYTDAHLSSSNLAYTAFLFLLMLCITYIWEFFRRRPFLKAVLAALEKPANLHEAQMWSTAETSEQKVIAELLQHYASAYLDSLRNQQRQREFFETFTTRFVHQMKTPITVLQFLEQDLRAYESAPEAEHTEMPEVAKIADAIAEERERLDSTISTLLYTSRLTAFEFDSHMELVNVKAVIRSVIQEHRTEFLRKGLSPKIVCDEDTTIQTDQKWFRFALDQLLKNALQYGKVVEDKTGRSSFIELEVVAGPDGVDLVCIDHGIGIPKHELTRVFDPFFTGTNGRTHSRATGMGLYLVRKIADQLGWTVHLESELHTGTKVTLHIRNGSYFAPAHPRNMTNL